MDTSGTKIDFRTFSSDQDWLSASTEFIVQTIQSQLFKGDICRIALSGGSTPMPVYREMVNQGIDVAKIEIFQVDERHVPVQSTDLNANMLRHALLLNTNQFHGTHFFDTTRPLLESVQGYEQTLAGIPQPLFHLTILGVGPDGHTASLFPYSEALQSNCLVAATTTDVFAGRERLTLTPRALMASETILILAKGKEKDAVIKAFIAGSHSVSELPIMSVRQHQNVHLFYQDS